MANTLSKFWIEQCSKSPPTKFCTCTTHYYKTMEMTENYLLDIVRRAFIIARAKNLSVPCTKKSLTILQLLKFLETILSQSLHPKINDILSNLHYLISIHALIPYTGEHYIQIIADDFPKLNCYIQFHDHEFPKICRCNYNEIT